MLDIQVKTEQLNELTKVLMALPGIFTRARRSALSSVGYMVMQELRNHVEYGGAGWQKLHPITLRLRKFRSAPPTPLFYLGRFARYLMDKEAGTLEIGFGKSNKGEPGQVDDPWLMAAVSRAESGQQSRVTKKVRLVWLSTKIKGSARRVKTRSGATLGNYFALRPDTTFLTNPKRPVIAPVFKKVKDRIPSYFEQKFYEAITRYQTGASKS